jgi:uncharacterized membrane protein YfcA
MGSEAGEGDANPGDSGASWPSVKAGGEPPPVAHRERMFVAEVAAGGIAGALAGSAHDVPASRLREVFARLLVAVAAFLLARNATTVL